MEYGTVVPRTSGTPQGGVISPVLANMFLHYVFDDFMVKEFSSIPWARYADDEIAHCASLKQAKYLQRRLQERFSSFGLELNLEKTRIVYCKDDNRKGNHEYTSFDFLGYTYRPRRSMDKYGRVYLNFLPSVSRDALKAMRQRIRSWHIQLMCDKEIKDTANMFNPILQGWNNYYGKFYANGMYSIWKHMNWYLTRWTMKKYKKLARHKRNARYALEKLARENPMVLVHWKLGYLPLIG